MSGPLEGIRIIELGSLGPGPFAAMMLADNGAEVIMVDRPGREKMQKGALERSRKVISLDLKQPGDLATLRDLLRDADGMIEGYRPGKLEQLGLEPSALIEENPRLVIGRMTGWGQTGPYAPYAGHDINYVSLTGAINVIGPAERPIPPLSLVGDYGGGGMLLAFGMCAALVHAQRTGKGQVIDAAICDGAGLLMTSAYHMMSTGDFQDRREANPAGGAAPFYGAFETRDGKFVSIASVEPQFYRELRQRTGLDADPAFDAQWDRAQWPALKAKVAALFRTKTRQEWCDILEHTDVCFAPVMAMSEAPDHPHAKARNSFVDVGGVIQPAPGPRYSLTPLAPPQPPHRFKQD